MSKSAPIQLQIRFETVTVLGRETSCENDTCIKSWVSIGKLTTIQLVPRRFRAFQTIRAQNGCKKFQGHFELVIVYSVPTKSQALPWTLNPRPSAINPQRSLIIPKPLTMYPQPYMPNLTRRTLNPKPSKRDSKP